MQFSENWSQNIFWSVSWNCRLRCCWKNFFRQFSLLFQKNCNVPFADLTITPSSSTVYKSTQKIISSSDRYFRNDHEKTCNQSWSHSEKNFFWTAKSTLQVSCHYWPSRLSTECLSVRFRWVGLSSHCQKILDLICFYRLLINPC